MIPKLPRSSRQWVNLVKYFRIESPFSILIFMRFSFSANFLWSLVFGNRVINAFHIEYGLSFPWRLETMWSQTPSRIILLTFYTHFPHSAKSLAFDVRGLGMSLFMNSLRPLSSIMNSILSFQSM